VNRKEQKNTKPDARLLKIETTRNLKIQPPEDFRNTEVKVGLLFFKPIYQ
jgi:hypothetical protein